MRASSPLIILAASALATAQSTLSAASAASSTAAAAPNTGLTGGVSGCGSAVDAIISNCLSTTQAQLASCAAADWSCMCEAVGNVLTCYNNCPSDPSRSSVLAQQTSWCGAAKAANPSSSSSSASAYVSGSMTANAVAASSSASMASDSSSASAASETAPAESQPVMQDSGAGKTAVSFVGALGAVMGLVAAF